MSDAASEPNWFVTLGPESVNLFEAPVSGIY
jgi:hypothetical protein